jgi:hypothetical protein
MLARLKNGEKLALAMQKQFRVNKNRRIYGRTDKFLAP